MSYEWKDIKKSINLKIVFEFILLITILPLTKSKLGSNFSNYFFSAMDDSTQILLAVVSSIGAVFALILGAFVCLYCWRRGRDDENDSEQVDKLVEKYTPQEADTRQLGKRSWEDKGANVGFQSGSPMFRKKTIK